jgi:hypothetical protein
LKAQRRRRTGSLDPLAQLCTAVAALPGGWWTARAAFERRQDVMLEDGRWTICYKIHAHRLHSDGKPDIDASITLWPPSRRRSKTATRNEGWNPQLLKKKWYESARRALARHGYKGSWDVSPYGRFGDFWKKGIKDTKAALAEVKVFDRVQSELDVLVID